MPQVIAASPERLQMVQNEVQLHSSLCHQNIVRLLDSEVVGARNTQHVSRPSASQTLASQPAATAAGSRPGEGFVAIDMAATGTASSASAGVGDTTAYLLFPAYPDGTLAEEVERLRSSGSSLTTAQVLDIFQQVGC